MILISALTSFIIFPDLKDSLNIFGTLVIIGTFVMGTTSLYYGIKIKKENSFNHVKDGYKFLKIVGASEIIFLVIIILLYWIGYIK